MHNFSTLLRKNAVTRTKKPVCISMICNCPSALAKFFAGWGGGQVPLTDWMGPSWLDCLPWICLWLLLLVLQI